MTREEIKATLREAVEEDMINAWSSPVPGLYYVQPTYAGLTYAWNEPYTEDFALLLREALDDEL